MLAEINGVLQRGQIPPAHFQEIQHQATTLEQLQRKFGPPPAISQSNDARCTRTDISRSLTLKPLTIKVMNRGVEEAAAVLSHYGWHGSQIRGVLKPAINPLINLNFTLLPNRQGGRPLSSPWSKQRKSYLSLCKTLIILFWVGGFMFVAISLILHML